MRTLVTGAGGYVGSAVVRAVLGSGHEVVAMTRQGLADPPGFVLAWTAAVYGAPDRQPIDETVPPNPRIRMRQARSPPRSPSPGNAAPPTRAASSSASSTSPVAGIPIRAGSCRPRSPSRSEERPHFTVSGDGTAVRDYVHIEDVAAAVEHANQPGTVETFDIGSGA